MNFLSRTSLQRIIATAAAVMSLFASASAGWTHVSDYDNGDMNDDGEKVYRSYWKYVPNGLGSQQELVIVLHGGGGSALSISNSFESRWPALADQHKFVVVLANGKLQPTQGRTWNTCANTVDTHHIYSDFNDVQFLNGIIDRIKTENGINTTKVFIAGQSRGGLMAMRMALESPNIRAIASHGVNMHVDPEGRCQVKPGAVSALLMKGTEDPLVDFYAGCLNGGNPDAGCYDDWTATVNYFKARNGTGAGYTYEWLPNPVTTDGPGTWGSFIGVDTWTSPNGSKTVQWKAFGAGHTVPGPTLNCDPEHETDCQEVRNFSGWKNQDVYAADVMWDFFSQF